MRQFHWSLGLLALASGCDCGNGPLGGTAVGFTVSGGLVDFGRVLEGSQESRLVTLKSAGRVDLSVDVATTGPPFSAPSSVMVPAGGTVDVTVVFTARTSVEFGTLTLSAHNKSVSVALRGEGVHPLPCVPSGPCRVSTFDLASETCVETQAADGTPCLSGSMCLDQTVCRAGACVGTPRNCDDGNVCTTDECSETAGCIHTPVQCPPPSNPCQAACDPKNGCNAAPTPDGTECGSVDCVTAHLCISGHCQGLSTPDGFICAPATPCQAQGRCKSHQCVKPDAGDLAPSFAVPLAGGPASSDPEAPTLLTFLGNLFWAGCGDADGGCFLQSFTFNGFQRFLEPFPDARPRWLAAVSRGGVVVETADAVEVYDLSTGAPLWSFAGASVVPPPELMGLQARTAPARTAVGSDGTVTAAFSWWLATVDAGADAGDGGGPADGGLDAGGGPPLSLSDAGEALGVQTLVVLTPDGGPGGWLALRGEGTDSVLARDVTGAVYAYEASGSLARVDGLDGGLRATPLGSWPGLEALAVSGGTGLVGASWLVATDGGGSLGPLALADAGGATSFPDPRVALAANGLVYLVERACLPPFVDGCAPVDQTPVLEALLASDGGALWASQCAPVGLDSRFEEAAVVQGGGVCLLSETQYGTGPETNVQRYGSQGERLFSCRVPPAGALVGGAFDDGVLYVLMHRPPLYWLEAYDLGGLPFETAGWPMRNGLSGAREER